MSRREYTLLLVGVILIACSLALSEWLNPSPPPSPSLHAEQARDEPSFSQSGLTLNVPESKRTMTLKNPRNIFAPLKDPDIPKKVQVSSERPSPPPPSAQPASSPTSPQSTGPSPAELAAKQAKEEMRQYKFFGYLTKEGIQQGFLSNGKMIYIVKRGETLEKGIAIKSLDAAEVVLSKYVKQAGTTVEATLPLTKDKQGGL